MPWHTVAKLADVPPGSSKEAIAEGKIVALFNVNGEFFALEGICPHLGGPLGKGKLQGCIVTCPWHGWQFDVRDGQFQLHHSIVQPQYETRVVGDDVQIEIND